jgi:hypothetical protein
VGGVTLAGLGIVLIVVGSVIGSTLNQVFAVALHRFATTGDMAPGFAPADMNAAFRQRKQR